MDRPPFFKNTTPVEGCTLPGGIWRIGIRRAVHGYSSELIYSLLPVFMVATLGASVVTVGIIASWRKVETPGTEA